MLFVRGNFFFFLGTYSEMLKLSVSQMISFIEFVIAEIFSCRFLVYTTL